MTALTVAVAVAAGCASKVESPELTLNAVSPPVVCNSAPSTTVILQGSGLGALPTGALTGAAKLALPQIAIQRVEDLDGSPITDEAAIVLDDPKAGISHEKALSDDKLELDLGPDQMLQPGVYNVLALSPGTDGKRAGLDRSLVIVPGLAVSKLDFASVCITNTGHKVTATGDGFFVADATPPSVAAVNEAGETVKTYPLLFNGCKMLPADINIVGSDGERAAFQVCKEASFQIGGTDLMQGAYKLIFTNPPPGDCGGSVVSADFTVVGAPTVTKVTPTVTCAKGARLTVNGTGFYKNATASPEARLCGQLPPAMPGVNLTMFVNATTLTGNYTSMTNHFDIGTKCDVEVTNPDGCKGSLPQAVDVIQGPDIAFVDTPVVYNGINTPFNVQTTLIHGMLGGASLTLNGAAMPTTAIAASIDPQHPLRINAVLTKGTIPAGLYDLTIADGTAMCTTTFAKAVTVTDKAPLMVTSVDHPVGSAGVATAETISGLGFLAVPRLYLSSGGTSTAVPVPAVTLVSPTTIAAVFPAVPAGTYDLVVINGDGTAGLLGKAFTANTMSLPRIDSVSPATVAANAMGAQPVTITGANFRKPIVTMQCGQAMVPDIKILLQIADTQLKIDAASIAGLPPGTTCTLRVTNMDDMGFAEFQAIAVSGPGGAVVNDTVGPDMTVARRGVALAALTPSGARHVLVAAGGDPGMTGGALDSVETLVVDGTGPKGSWQPQAGKLVKGTTLAGAIGIGRYVYLVGGNDGAAPVTTVQRAVLLDPGQAPTITDAYLEPAPMGLASGYYSYRVAAVLDDKDADNPGGETLPSPAWVVFVPAVGPMVASVKATISWKPVTGAVGYRVYRSPMADGGAEALLGAVGAVTSFEDSGAMTMEGSPVPPGSLTKWTRMPSLGTARESPAIALGADPVKAGTFYLYALGGRDAQGRALSSYELLGIAIAGNGSQTVGQWTAGMKTLGAPRYQASGFMLVQSGTTYVYVGGGTSDGMNALASVETGTVAGGGDLGTFTGAGATLGAFGAASVSPPGALFAVGAGPPSKVIQSALPDLMLPALTGFTNQQATLTNPRYLAGAAVDGPALFVAGGSTMGVASATATTEWMVY